MRILVLDSITNADSFDDLVRLWRRGGLLDRRPTSSRHVVHLDRAHQRCEGRDPPPHPQAPCGSPGRPPGRAAQGQHGRRPGPEWVSGSDSDDVVPLVRRTIATRSQWAPERRSLCCKELAELVVRSWWAW